MTGQLVEMVPANSDLVPTRAYRAINALLGDAMQAPENGMGLITGIAGIGKTAAIRAFARGAAGVVHLELSPLTAGKQTGLKALCELVGEKVGEKGPKLLETTKRRLWALQPTGSNTREALVVIDEAQHAEIELLEVYRYLWDQLEIGFVLVGNQKLEETFEELRHKHPQIRSRIGSYLKLEGIDESDLDLFCRSFNATPEARELVRSLSRLDGGALRVARNLLVRARGRSGSSGVIIREHVEFAARKMGLWRE